MGARRNRHQCTRNIFRRSLFSVLFPGPCDGYLALSQHDGRIRNWYASYHCDDDWFDPYRSCGSSEGRSGRRIGHVVVECCSWCVVVSVCCSLSYRYL